MRNAQAKIDALLEALVARAEAAIGTSPGWAVPEGWREEVEWLIKMSNLNMAQLARTGRPPGPASKLDAEMSDKDLLKELMQTRDPENFPRRGPRNGKREPVAAEPKSPS